MECSCERREKGKNISVPEKWRQCITPHPSHAGGSCCNIWRKKRRPPYGVPIPMLVEIRHLRGQKDQKDPILFPLIHQRWDSGIEIRRRGLSWNKSTGYRKSKDMDSRTNTDNRSATATEATTEKGQSSRQHFAQNGPRLSTPALLNQRNRRQQSIFATHPDQKSNTEKNNGASSVLSHP